jgi:SAM-dependent methyltransferase
MRPEQDAYGQEVYDYFHGQKAIEIIERSDGMIDVSSGPAAYFAPFAEWPPSERQASQHAHGRVLDVGCGPGRVCLHLQEKGHVVVGIDNSPLAIKTATLRGVREARILPVTQLSRKTLGVFDTIVMFGNNFGLFGNPRRAKWLLRRFYGMTSSNGLILAESLDIYDTEEPDHLAYQAWNRQHGRMSGQIRLRVRYKRLVGEWFDYLMVSRPEMETILQDTGWQIQHVFQEAGSANYVAIIAKA